MNVRTQPTTDHPRRATGVTLIVEPHAFLAAFYEMQLMRSGHATIVSVRSAARVSLRQLRPETILFGIDTLGKRPLATIRRARAACPDARIVAVVSSDDPAWNLLARAVGLDAVLGPTSSYGDFTAATTPRSPAGKENAVRHRTLRLQ